MPEAVEQDVRRVRRARSFAPRYPGALTLPWLVYCLLVFAGPMAVLLLFSVSVQGERFGEIVYTVDFGSFRLLRDALYVEVFVRTVGMAALGTIATLIVGYPLAYWLARHARRRGLALLLIVIPYLTSFLIRTYAWLIILDPNGWLARVTGGAIADWLYSWKAIAIGLVYGYLPLLVLPVYASLERMDWRLVEAAEDLGTPPRRAWRQITLPLTLPGLITGTLLVFIPMCGEYVIPNILGGGKFPFVGAVVGDQFLAAQNYPFGAAMAIALMLVLTAFVVVYMIFAVREEQFGS